MHRYGLVPSCFASCAQYSSQRSRPWSRAYLLPITQAPHAPISCPSFANSEADRRYLEENATPEWKRAYIDYRGAKKAIKRAVASRENQAVDENNDFSSEEDDADNGPSAKPRDPSSPSALSRIISGSPRTPATARSGKTPKTGPSPLSPRPGRSLGKSPGVGGTRVSTRPGGRQADRSFGRLVDGVTGFRHVRRRDPGSCFVCPKRAWNLATLRPGLPMHCRTTADHEATLTPSRAQATVLRARRLR